MVRSLTVHADLRGTLTEMYRREWQLGCDAVQVNCVTNSPNVLRGVHVHVRHVDHLVVVNGGMGLGLHDLRPWSADFGRSCTLPLEAANPSAVAIPPGVAHGLYSPESSVLIHATSSYWDPADEFGCRWDCPELGLHWPTQNPLLSPRDSAAGSYMQMTEKFIAAWNAVHGRNSLRT